jgi:hypothetical protein
MFINKSTQFFLNKLRLRRLKGAIIYAFIGIIIIVIFLEGWIKSDVLAGIIIGFLMGKADTIWKYDFSNKEGIEKIIQNPLKGNESQFKAQIVSNKYYYSRGENIQFESKYKGKLKRGYFANELFPIARKFHLNTHFINEDGSSVMSYCFDTVENLEKKIGKIDGVVDRDWIY